MENLEQLKADNAKLTERLNNAAKFFREQKATIEKLTEEAKDKDVEIANQKDALESCYKQLHDLEMMTDSLNKENEELKRKPQEEVIDTKKWNALVTEKEDLNKQLNEYELKLQASEKSYEELKEMYDNEINHFNKEQSAYENQITLLEEDNIKLGHDVHKQKEYIEKMEREHEVVINDLKKENKEAEEQFNKILDSCEEEVQKQKDEITLLNTQLGETEERCDKLNIQLDKLAEENKSYEADIMAIEERYKAFELEVAAEREANAKFKDYTKKIFELANEMNIFHIVKVNTNNTVKSQTTVSNNQFMTDAPEFNV